MSVVYNHASHVANTKSKIDLDAEQNKLIMRQTQNQRSTWMQAEQSSDEANTKIKDRSDAG
jgi:hypothetical protein